MAELDTSKINEILNYYGLKTNIEETKKWVKQYVAEALTGITTDLMTNVTYNELVSLRDNNNLKPGMLYRMTDYVTKVYSEDGSVSSAEHPFDLILFANTTNSLNENALATLHDGDEYFGQIVASKKTYYRWKYWGDPSSYIPYYILTEQKVYTNSPDGHDGEGNYYYTTYPIYMCLTVDDEDWETYYKWRDQKKSILYTEGNVLVIGSLAKDGESNKWYFDQTYDFDGVYEEIEYKTANLNTWEIKYSLDNDDRRFEFGSVKKEVELYNYEALVYVDEDDGEYVYYYHIPEFTIDGNYIYTPVNAGFETPSDFEDWLENDRESGINYFSSFMIPEGSLTKNVPILIPFNNVYIYNKNYKLTDGSIKYYIYTHGKQPVATTLYFDNASGNRILSIVTTSEYAISDNGLYVLNSDCQKTSLWYYSGETVTSSTMLYTAEYDHSEVHGKTTYVYYNLTSTNIHKTDETINTVIYNMGDIQKSSITPIELFEESTITKYVGEDGKGIIYYMKDEFNNEAPFDFKNILQKDEEYTFGNNGEDYSLLGYANSIYNNKILPCIDSESGKQTINKIRVTGKNCHTNYFKPTCVNSYINFPVSECDISMNRNGELVIFKTADFISGIENHEIPQNMRKEYLTIEALEDDTTIKFVYLEGADWEADDMPHLNATIYYSINNGDWRSVRFKSTYYPDYTTPEQITINKGDKVRFKSNSFRNGGNGWNDDYCAINRFYVDKEYLVYGNIMSLIGMDDFSDLVELSHGEDEGFFNCLFVNTLVNISKSKKLILPATSLTDCCYYGMFFECTSLETAPELPATTLAGECYREMFWGCTSLSLAPELPATTLAGGCYEGMFYGCTSLTSAPELPATTLANNCYYSMFSNCTSLTTAPVLPATTLTGYCYYQMFSYCISLTTAPKLPAATLAKYCYGGMFRGCTSLTEAPELSASALTEGCYGGPSWDYQKGMFNGCHNLSYIKCLAITGIDQLYSTTNWVNGVAASGTFVKHPDADWGEPSVNTTPVGWTVIDNNE